MSFIERQNKLITQLLNYSTKLNVNTYRYILFKIKINILYIYKSMIQNCYYHMGHHVYEMIYTATM